MDKKDLFIVGTLGMGGFGRVELVSVLVCVWMHGGHLAVTIRTYIRIVCICTYVRM